MMGNGDPVLALRRYWKQYRPAAYLFPARYGDGTLSISAVQRMYYGAKKRAGITKPGGKHMLRHAYATHSVGLVKPALQFPAFLAVIDDVAATAMLRSGWD